MEVVMSVEEVRMSLRRQLEETFGMDEAAMLMDRPPGGWDQLVTKEYLDLRFAAVDARFDGLEGRFESRFDAIGFRFESLEGSFGSRFDAIGFQFEALEHKLMGEIKGVREDMQRLAREQTWRLVTAFFAAVSVFGAVVGGVAALLRV
jgi:hypothetical protein